MAASCALVQALRRDLRPSVAIFRYSEGLARSARPPVSPSRWLRLAPPTSASPNAAFKGGAAPPRERADRQGQRPAAQIPQHGVRPWRRRRSGRAWQVLRSRRAGRKRTSSGPNSSSAQSSDAGNRATFLPAREHCSRPSRPNRKARRVQGAADPTGRHALPAGLGASPSSQRSCSRKKSRWAGEAKRRALLEKGVALDDADSAQNWPSSCSATATSRACSNAPPSC